MSSRALIPTLVQEPISEHILLHLVVMFSLMWNIPSAFPKSPVMLCAGGRGTGREGSDSGSRSAVY